MKNKIEPYSSREANFEIALVRGFTNEKSLVAVPNINEVLAMLIGERLVEVQGLSTGYDIRQDHDNGKVVGLEVFRHPSELEFVLQECQDKSTSRGIRDWMVAGAAGAVVDDVENTYIPGPTFLIFETNKERTTVYDCWAFQDMDIVEFNNKPSDRDGFHAKVIDDADVTQYTLSYTVRVQHSNDEHMDQDALGKFSVKVMQAIVAYEKNTGKVWDKQLSSLGINLTDTDVPSVLK